VIRVELVRAWPRRHESIAVEVADGAQVGDALDAAGWRLDTEFTGLAVFGLAATLATPLHAGDRIELLRRLELDPKQARRLRAERARGKTARERS
jgi:putative ubiquitin-RnfH superfamily antitoxin RatB of RatAB toxin-antitoxin module